MHVVYLSSYLLSSHFFSSLTPPTSAATSVDIVGSLTSNLPSNTVTIGGKIIVDAETIISCGKIRIPGGKQIAMFTITISVELDLYLYIYIYVIYIYIYVIYIYMISRSVVANLTHTWNISNIFLARLSDIFIFQSRFESQRWVQHGPCPKFPFALRPCSSRVCCSSPSWVGGFQGGVK